MSTPVRSSIPMSRILGIIWAQLKKGNFNFLASSEAEYTRLSLALSETPKTGFLPLEPYYNVMFWEVWWLSGIV